MFTRLLRPAALFLPLAFVAAACGHEVESPDVTVAKLEPDLVCAAQRLAPSVQVTVHGDGFTPMPVQTLEEPVAIVLPSLTLALSAGLDGSAKTGTLVKFPGDPRLKDPFSNNVTWTSPKEMAFRVTEADAATVPMTPLVALDQGLYDLTVTNPDNTHSARRPHALAVVPPPVVDSITVADVDATKSTPPVVCTVEGTRELTVTGTNFLKVGAALPTVEATVEGGTAETLDVTAAAGCVAVAGEFLGGPVELCTTLTVKLVQGMKSDCDHAGKKYCVYSVAVRSPAGVPDTADCRSTESITFATVPAPFVTDVVPPAICVDQTDQTLTIQGGQFLEFKRAPTDPQDPSDLPTVTLQGGTTTKTYVPTLQGCTDVAGMLGASTTPATGVCDSLQIVVKVGDLPPGTYKLTVTNPDPAGCSAVKDAAVTVNPPPRVDSVVPAKVCTGGGTLDVNGSGFLPGATVGLDCNQDGTPDVTATNVVVATGGNQLTATFGPGVNDGDTCDVLVSNADGCVDRPLPHKTIAGTLGPLLFYVDPAVAYNGIYTKITLYVTAVVGTPTVSLIPDDPASCAATGATALTDALIDPQHANRIQATVPKGQAACVYDVVVTDGTGCDAVLDKGLSVTDQLTIQVTAIEPSSGKTGQIVPVQITGAGFAATPRAFLSPPNPTPTDVARQLEGTSFIDATKLTAVVPDTPVGTYDLVVVNPDGSVGLLANAYRSLAGDPPSITGLTPQSVVNQGGQSLTVRGTGFDPAATITVDCRDIAGATVGAPTVGATTCTATTCTTTLDATATPNGAICVITVTNPDGALARYSALGIVNSSLNLQNPVATTALTTGRRALMSAAVRANGVSRFVYAIGGDGGSASAATPFSSVEVASVDLFGKMSPWAATSQSMKAARSFLAGASVGRYVYAVGGSDGAAALSTSERALVLSPAEIAHVEDVDICLSADSTGTATTNCFGKTTGGLDAGEYSYRIAAVIDNADPVNLGGETLASDPTIIKVPAITNRKFFIQLTWSAPKDALGATLSGITGYRIYRSPSGGVAGQDEVLLASVGTTTLIYVDDGSATLGTEKPLPQGSTSAWQALPNLGAARTALASVAAADPNDATKWYVYALQGEGLTSYDYLPLTLQANGRQTVGTWTAGSVAASVARHEFGAWVVTAATTSLVTAPDTWIYLGGGRTTGAGRTGAVDAARVLAGGDLGTFDTTPDDFSSIRAGYAAFVASTKLFSFGGASLPGGGTQNNAIGAQMQAPLPSLVNWNNEGLSMTTARYLHGSSVESAFVFLIGGEATTGGPALTSTESLAW